MRSRIDVEDGDDTKDDADDDGKCQIVTLVMLMLKILVMPLIVERLDMLQTDYCNKNEMVNGNETRTTKAE